MQQTRGGRGGLEDCRSRDIGELCCTGLRGLACFGAGPALLVCGGAPLLLSWGALLVCCACSFCADPALRLIISSPPRLIVSSSHRLIASWSTTCTHVCLRMLFFAGALQRRSGLCFPPAAGGRRASPAGHHQVSPSWGRAQLPNSLHRSSFPAFRTIPASFVDEGWSRLWIQSSRFKYQR